MKLTDLLFEVPQENEFVSSEEEKEFNEYIDGVILDPIINRKRYLNGKLTENIYYVKKPEAITYYYSQDEGKTPIAAVYGWKEVIDNKTAYRGAFTKKFDSKYENAALKLYSYVSKNVNSYIVSDQVETTAMKKNWQKWLKNPNVFGIKEIYIYNVVKKERIVDSDINKYWRNDFWFQRFRVIARWV